MNVAVVLSGHMRCWNQVFPNFKEQFIDRYSPDVFIHTWDNEGWWVPQEGAIGIHEQSDALDPHAACDAYKPIKMVVEHFDNYLTTFAKRAEGFPNFYHRPRNIISMFYKMGAAMNLLEEHIMQTGKKYDLVIRMRPDMILHDAMPNFDPNTFYTLAHRNHMGGGTGDMFQIGSYENVSRFATIGMKLEEYYAETGLLCPHTLSVHHIQKLGLPWNEFHINKTIQHTPAGQYQPV
jgi:hypothetical protein